MKIAKTIEECQQIAAKNMLTNLPNMPEFK